MQDVAITGMATVPSDYACQDGQSAWVHNLVHEYGEIRPLNKPKSVMDVPIGFKFIYVHDTSLFKHYIFQSAATDENGEVVKDFYNYYYCDAADENQEMVEFGKMQAEITRVEAVGNTLVVLTDNGLRYYLWKNSAYKSLGDSIPEVGMRFGLLGEPILYSKECSEADGVYVHFDFEVYPNDRDYTYKREYLTEYSNLMLAPVAKLVSEHVTNKGKFCFPFFVRYALRLYDGSLVHHSAPVMMFPSTYQGVMPFLRSSDYDKTKLTDCRVDVFAMRAALTFMLEDNITKKFKEDWGDIVKSVDIFVSAPLYTYNAGGVVEDIHFTKINNSDYAKNSYVGRLKDAALQWGKPSTVGHISGDYTKYHGEFNFVDLFNAYCWPAFLQSAGEYGKTDTIALPVVTDDEMRKKVTDCSSFYLLKSLSLNELINASEKSRNGEETIVDVKNDYLQSLVNREVMTDDYHTHEKITAKRSYVYNSRLNLAGVTRQLYDGYPVRQAFCRYDGKVPVSYSGAHITFGEPALTYSTEQNAFTVTVEDGREIKLYTEGKCAIYVSEYNRVPTLFFYPDTAVKDVVWWKTQEGTLKPFMQEEAKMHDFLNASYISLYHDSSYIAPTLPSDKGDEDKRIESKTSIYTSSVNNPFYFPATGVNDVGIGEIIGMKSAVAAMSQGQFGQYPLYAFTKNGVWALSVGSDGSYQTATPVTRDVCNNENAIISLDKAVLLPTSRGIMMLVGSQSSCITDELREDPALFLHHDVVKKLSQLELIEENEIPRDNFLQFLQGAGMAYDYTRQRVIIFNKNERYAYVLSLNSKTWSTTRSIFQYSVNSYPDGLAITQEGVEAKLVNICDDGDAQGGILVTRPMKLNNAHALGTVNDVIVRGNYDKKNVAAALLGTRDFKNYSYIGSGNKGRIARQHGTPYKAFVVVAKMNLEGGEAIDALSVEYQMRQNNRMR